MTHLPHQHQILIGRGREDADGALAGIVQRVDVVGPINGSVENLGTRTLTLTAYESSDNGLTDSWDALSLWIEDSEESEIALVPKGRAQFWIASGTKAFIKFEATPVRQVTGRIILNVESGRLDPRNYAESTPTAPSSLTLTPVDTGSISLAWTDNSNDEAEFHIERGVNGTDFTEVKVVSAGVVAWTDTGLTEGTRYYYRIRAKGNDVFSSYASANARTYCAAPSSLVATQFSDTRIDLAWTDNSAGETSFSVERSANGTSGWSEVGTPAANATTFSNTGLTQNTRYYYRVKAVNASGGSVASNVSDAFTKLATPTVLGATGGSNKIDLAWTDNASGETGYSVERSNDGTTGWTEIATPAANAATYSDTTVTTGQTRYYRVRATKTGVNSAYSNTANATAS